MGRYEEAKVSFLQAEELDVDRSVQILIVAYQLNDMALVQARLEQIGRNNGTDSRSYRTSKAYIHGLQGDYDLAREVIAPEHQRADVYTPFLYRSLFFARLEGQTGESLDLMSEAFGVNEYNAFLNIQEDPFLRSTWPQWLDHPRHGEILQEIGLDPVSVSKLNIPPLPF